MESTQATTLGVVSFSVDATLKRISKRVTNMMYLYLQVMLDLRVPYLLTSRYNEVRHHARHQYSFFLGNYCSRQ